MSRTNPSDKKIKTASIALRIALRSALFLTVCFVFLDLVILAIETKPAVMSAHGFEPSIRAAGDALSSALGNRRMNALFEAEGIAIVLCLCFNYAGARRRLEPLDELAKAAMDLSRCDPSFGSASGFASGFTSGSAAGPASGQQRFQKLESAIENLEGSNGEVLSTGDKELEGLESAVNNLMERMREQNRQQARFVSDASHELRTPIAVIRGYADMLSRWGKEDEKVLEESIAAIKAESENMQKLVEQLLFLARGDAGKTPVEKKEFDLCAMVRETAEEYAMIDPSHIYIYDGPAALQALGDPALLKQALRVLADNAAKYSPDGSEIILRVSEEGGRPAFSAEDLGIGMDEEEIAHIFERFYRADPSRSKESGGAGLGLSIAKWIVDRHGGRIYAVSRKGIGTRMTVVL